MYDVTVKELAIQLNFEQNLEYNRSEKRIARIKAKRTYPYLHVDQHEILNSTPQSVYHP